MSTNFDQPGNTIRVTAPRVLTSGEGCLVGFIFGVAADAAGSGDEVEITTEGCWFFPKQAALVVSQGDTVYWDDTAFEVDTTNTNFWIGQCIADAAAGDTHIRVRLAAAVEA